MVGVSKNVMLASIFWKHMPFLFVFPHAIRRVFDKYHGFLKIKM